MTHFWNSVLFPLLASKATTSTVAIVAAVGIFIVYFLRRRDNKRDAANIILLELKNSVEKVNEARKTYENGQTNKPPAILFPDRLRLMPTASWDKYKYLFVRNLEPEQWAMVGEYYDHCKEFDLALKHRDNAFRLNEKEIRAGIQRNISNLAKKTAKELQANPSNDPAITLSNNKIEDDAVALSDNTIRLRLSKFVYIYNPDKSFTDAKYYFELLPENIMETPTGQKIRKLAGVKN